MKQLQIWYLCIAFFALNTGQAQQEANLLFHWSDSSLPGSFAYNNTYNEVWGLAVNNHEFAVIGSTMGTHIFDITDPNNANLVHFIPGAAQGGQIIHRDYHDHQGYLYAVSDEGPSTLQIIDISQLPASIEVVYDSDDLFRTAHNIFIDEERCKLYTFYTNGGGFHPLRVYDLQDPTNPVLLENYTSISGHSLSGGVHDGYVYRDTAYLNVGGQGLYVADFSDASNPQMVGVMTNYIQQGYNHSGWRNDAGSHYFLADETHGKKIKSVDISDHTDMSVVSTFGTDSDPNAIVHNLIVACDKLYVSYYYDGLQVYDISDPDNPTLSAYYDTYNSATQISYHGAWGVYPLLPSGNVLVSDMQTGLYLFEGFDSNCKPNIQLCTTTATKKPSYKSSFSVYPNPIVSHFQIESTKEISPDAIVQLKSSTGTTIQTWDYQSTGNYTITKKIPFGLYVLSIWDGRNSYSQSVLGTSQK